MGNIQLFEQMASRYDTPDRIRVAEVIAGAIRRHVGEGGRDKTALDYGCGTGLVGLALTDLFRSVLLVDAAPGMVAEVRRKIEALGLQGASALSFDLTQDSAPQLCADYVILAQVLLHIRDVPAMLGRLHGLLKGGGHLIIVDFDRDEAIVSDKVHSGFEQGELIRLCKAAGFSGAEAHSFYRGEKIFMGRDASLFLLDAAIWR